MEFVDWSDDGPAVVLLDQRALPHETVWLTLRTVDEVVDAIRDLAVRGAPSLGIAGAYGAALACALGTPEAADRVATARPTAVPLSLGVRRVLTRADDGPAAALAEARAVATEAAVVNARATEHAADLVQELTPGPVRALTVCNTGDLACGPGGSALGAILRLHDRGVLTEVLACETRPLLQGARLTVWELARAGAPHRLCVDSAGPAAIASGLVDAVLVGADRIAANGDTANKIGTYMLACAAARSGVPFLVVAPEETIDPGTPTGADIVVEERGAQEVRGNVTLAGTPVYNPAFDVTPRDLITAIVTEKGALRQATSRSDTVQSRSAFSGSRAKGATPCRPSDRSRPEITVASWQSSK